MGCKEVQELLGQFHDGELGPADRIALEIHLGDCPVCTAELGAIAELAEMTRTLVEPELSGDLWGKIACRLVAAGPTHRRMAWGGFRRRRAALVAALVLVALATGWIAFKNGKPPVPSFPPFDSLVANQAGERMSLQEAARRVDFRVLSTGDLPNGYRLEECCLCRAGYCDVVACKFLRGTDRVLLVQCNPNHPLRYGDGPVLETKVNGKPARIVWCDGCLAASWQTEETAMSLVGLNDLSELVRLISYVDEHLQEGKP